MDKRLKPCPFCGSKNVKVWGVEGFWVECEECNCKGPYPLSMLHDDVDSAIAAWNRRAE